MGRSLAIIAILSLLTGCLTTPTEPCTDSDIILLPHHLVVEPVIRDMYETISHRNPKKVIVVSPNHFLSGAHWIAPASEEEHAYTIHRDFLEEYFPQADVEGWMLKAGTPHELLLDFTDSIDEDALFIFSIDFSHYLPGQIAYVHDVRSKDVIEARSIDEAASLEVDSPESVEVMLRLAKMRKERIEILRNTNPSLDIGDETFENTTHMFGCSALGNPPNRQVRTKMLFANSEDWYRGKTEEDRYLYGYDEVEFEQGGVDTAKIDYTNGFSERFKFDYFKTDSNTSGNSK